MIEFHDIPAWISSGEKELKLWLTNVADDFESRIKSLSYQFLDKDAITEMNKAHLGHDYETDIITFGYEEGSTVAGDVLIGEEVVRINALRFGVSHEEEMHRVMAHGLLHLIGFNDTTDEEREKMRDAEEKALILRPEKLKEH